jgi:aminopeptidase S
LASIGQWTGASAPRTGTWASWISGFGFQTTETLDQTVPIPTGCATYTLSMWLKIHTDETGSTVFDTFTIKVGSTVLATFSNANAGPYTQRSFNLAAFAGQNVVISFTGSEDDSLQTSFVLDDLSLTVT